MIPSNKVFLPPREEYEKYLDAIWESGWVTNNGQLLQRLEERLEERFDAQYVRIVANGTLALQLALRVLDLEGKIITTPFSYVATTSALVWETKCEPVFVDIKPDTFNLDPSQVGRYVGPNTGAILPTHVFGNPCDVDALQQVADRHNLKILYDGAHAFGTEINGQSVLKCGDLTAVSFHATKLFHSVEGGAIITDDPEIAERVDLLRAFGHRGNDHQISGINAKNSEFHAAMGLCLLPRIDAFIKHRREMYERYRSRLDHLPLQFQTINKNCTYNFSYFPVVLPTHECMVEVKAKLEEKDIYPRRYFSPSLNRLPYVNAARCPNAEDIAQRILCLPFFQEITTEQVDRVAAAVDEVWDWES